jgi:hypothetical protein
MNENQASPGVLSMRCMALSSMLLAILSATLATASVPPAASPGDSELRQAVTTLAEKPLSPEGAAAAMAITAFANASEDVVVTLSEAALPWMKQPDTPHAELLLAAYIGGNVLGQLDAGVTGNDPWSGVLQVFRVYRALKAADPKARVASIESLQDEARRGKLAARLLGAAVKAPMKPSPATAKPNALDSLQHGVVPDEATAIRIAVAVWEPIYGAESIAGQQPYVAVLKDGVWSVHGSLPENFLGGVAEADIAQADGRVLRVIHGK